MDISRGVANCLVDGAKERNDVVVCIAFDLAHTIEIACCAANLFDCPCRDAVSAVPSFARRLFDGEPGLDLLILAPNPAHFGSGIALDQSRSWPLRGELSRNSIPTFSIPDID